MKGPTREALLAAVDRTVPDVIGPDLGILFCGINPGLFTAYTGNHFAGPGNRFWPSLHAAGFTPRRFTPAEKDLLLPLGYGITNVVSRTTATAAELTAVELEEGGRILREKVAHYQPRCLAVLGIGAYRAAFGDAKAQLGRQPQALGETTLWVLPNPSGLNAHYPASRLAELFRELRLAVEGGA